MQPLECGVVMQDNESLTQFVKKWNIIMKFLLEGHILSCQISTEIINM
jgi:hypothetical protein